MLVVVIVSDFDVFEHAQGVIGQYGGGEVERQQVRGHAEAVQAHQPRGEARQDFSGNAGLMQAHHALIGFAHAQQQNARRAEPLVRLVAALHFQLVAGHQRHAAPGDHRRAEKVDRHRGHAAPRAFALERGDRLRMRQKERGLLPDQRQQFVQIVGRRRAVPRADPHRRIDRVDQAEFLAVDDIPFLTLLDAFDRQPHLLFQLIVGIVVQIGDARMHADHGLHRRKRILAGRGRVIDERFRNLHVLGEARHQVDVPLPVAIDRGTQFLVLRDRLAKSLAQVRLLGQDRVEILAREGQQNAGRGGADGHVRRSVGDEVALAEKLAFRKQGDPQIAAVNALAENLDLPLGDDEELAAVFAFDDQLIAQRDFFGFEAIGHPGEDRLGKLGKQRHAAQRLGLKNAHAAGDLHADPLGFAQFHLGAIHPVRAAIDLHPRQHAQQPTRSDRHHLRRGLGRTRQISGNRSGYAALQ